MAADRGAEPAPDTDTDNAAMPSMRTLLAAGAAAEAVCTPPRAPSAPERDEAA